MRPKLQQIMFNGESANGVSAYPQKVFSYRHLFLQLAGYNTASFKVKVQGSFSQDCPDFSSAQSSTNQWDYIQSKDLNDGSTINGDAGFSFSGDDVRIAEVNVNGLMWISIEITNYATGNVKALLVSANDEE